MNSVKLYQSSRKFYAISMKLLILLAIFVVASNAIPAPIEQMHEALWYNNDLNREDQDSSGSGFMGDREFGDSSSIQMDFDRVFDDMDQFSSESGFLEEKEDAVAWI